MLFTSLASITWEGETLQNNEILSLTDFEISFEVRQKIISGSNPISLNFITLCWVGLVFNSSLASTYGNNVTWDINTLSFPCSILICLIVSRNGKLSMSPTVPPTSTITTSKLFDLFIEYTLLLISLVIWGITWIVWPK